MQDTVYISGLEPLIAPDKVGFWPPAPGWYLLAVLAILLLLFLGMRFVRRYRLNLYRRGALADLSHLADEAGDQPGQVHLQKLNHLLKQTAIQVWPREFVASLTGKDWETFLEATVPGTRPAGPDGKLSDPALYAQEQRTMEISYWKELLDFSMYWIRAHKIP